MHPVRRARAEPARPHLDAWRTELLAYWAPDRPHRCQQRPDRSTDALMKKVKRVGHGFRNLDNYRLRLLLTVGLDCRTVPWQPAPATPIRGRSPRLVA